MRELVQERPEKLFEDRKGATPTRKFVYLLPVDILAVETVAGLGVGGELRPKIVQGAAFTDALPEILSPANNLRRARGCLRTGAGVLLTCEVYVISGDLEFSLDEEGLA